MHTPSINQVLVSSLLAVSTMSSYESAGPHNLAPHHVGALLALAIPAYGFPLVAEDRSPEPHHAGKRGKGNKDSNKRDPEPLPESEPHHAGKKPKRNKNTNKREPDPIPAPQPHHVGKKGKGNNGNKNNKREPEPLPEPHHAGKKPKGNKAHDKREPEPHHVGKRAREIKPATD